MHLFNANEIELNWAGLESKTQNKMPAVRPIKDAGHKATNLFLEFLVNVKLLERPPFFLDYYHDPVLRPLPCLFWAYF